MEATHNKGHDRPNMGSPSVLTINDAWWMLVARIVKYFVSSVLSTRIHQCIQCTATETVFKQVSVTILDRDENIMFLDCLCFDYSIMCLFILLDLSALLWEFVFTTLRWNQLIFWVATESFNRFKTTKTGNPRHWPCGRLTNTRGFRSYAIENFAARSVNPHGSTGTCVPAETHLCGWILTEWVLNPGIKWVISSSIIQS